MHLGKRITIGLIALPVAELIAFVLVATWIGVTAALALMVLTSLAGALVLRRVGRNGIAQFRIAVTDDTATGGMVSRDGLLVVLGGILLVLPGFITDIAGALLLVPWTRRQLGATFRRASSASADQRRGDAVVDLAPGEWRQVGDPELPRPADRIDNR